MNHGFRLLPEQASTIAARVDALYFYLLSVAGFFTLLICVLVLGFGIRYRRSARRHGKVDASWRLPLELTWSLIPLALTMVMFAWGAELYFELRRPPPGALEIQVVAKQWMWKLQQPTGKREINELHVPRGEPVRLRMISEDVIHSFYVPAFRVKQDVLPGRYVTAWFEATRAGRYHLFCAEYCGTSHSQMVGEVVVMEPADYAQWLREGDAPEPPRVAGAELFGRLRCNTCHRPGSAVRCPPLDEVFGRDVHLADGRTVAADENYLRESILDPGAKVVAGFRPLMPTYRGQVDEEGLFQLIEYLKTIGTDSRLTAMAHPSSER